jgi:hypothetical protein
MNYVEVTHPGGEKIKFYPSDFLRMDHFITKDSQYTRIELKGWGLVVCNESPEEVHNMILKISGESGI